MSTTESRRPAGGAARRLARMRRRYLSFAAPITLAMALVLGASALIAETHTARTASAAEIPGAITSVSIAEESTTYYADFEVDLTWSVPDSATAGDTFSFVLPQQVVAHTNGFDLRDSQGRLVAVATISGGVVTFTLTDYADTFNAVSGSAFFSAAWNSQVVTGGGPVTVDFVTSTQTFTDTVQVGSPGSIDRGVPRKYGSWTDAADQGVTNPTDALQWRVESARGPFESVRMQDSVGGGHEIDCSSLRSQIATAFDSAGNATNWADTGTVSSSCSTAAIDVTFPALPDGAVYRLKYATTVTDATLGSYSNGATVTQDGAPWTGSAKRVRTVAGGTGGGFTEPHIDIEKYASSLGATDGDADAAPGLELDANAPTPITFAIKNDGNETLVDLTVADTTDDGVAITDLSCDFSALGGPSSGTTWAGPFAVGAAFACTGSLPAMGWSSTHADTASVTATSQTTAVPVSDEDEFHATTPEAPPAEVSVGDYVWFDTDGDGLQDAGEPGIEGVTLTISGPDGGPVTDVDGEVVGPVDTDADGAYSFDHLPVLPAGEHYTVHLDGESPALDGYVPTIAGAGDDRAVDSSTDTAESTDLTDDGASDTTLDFGFVTAPVEPPAEVSVGDHVWFDTDGDGLQDAGEPGIEGVTLTITGPDGGSVTDVDGNVVGTVTTDADGLYSFDHLPVLPAGEHYTVHLDGGSSALDGYVPTSPEAGDDRAVDSSTGFAESGDLTDDGDRDPTLDFGFVEEPVAPPAEVSVGDKVWFDVDGDGIQDDADPGIGGVTLTLTGPDGGEVTDVFGNPVGPVQTATDGMYSFDHLPVLPAGEHYTVHLDGGSPALDGYVPTTAGVGDDRAVDSSTGSAESTDLTDDGDRDPTLDFGFVAAPVEPPAEVSVGDVVWFDTDGDGVQDAGEPGIEGVTLTITGPDGGAVTDVDGNVVGPVATDADGLYSFDHLPVLPAGEHYTVHVDGSSPALDGYVPTSPEAGDDRAVDSSTGFAESGDLTDDGDRDPTLDFGFVEEPVAPPAEVSVGDKVWFDVDGDGIQDDADPGIGGVTLTITGPDGAEVTDVFGNPVGPVQTLADGSYSFDHLPVLDAGDHYTVHLDGDSPALDGYQQTTAGAGDDRAVDSSTGSAESTDLTTDGASDVTLDFGFVAAPVEPPAEVSVGDVVWFDTDGDGLQDAGEPGIEGVTLTIAGPDGGPVTDVNGETVGPVETDADGLYVFDHLPVLPAGEHYTVHVDGDSPALDGYTPTTPGVGDDRAVDSSTGSAESTDLTSDGASDVTLDFGFTKAPVFDLALRKTVAESIVGPGDLVPFTITVFNQGGIAATDVVVTDTPPAGLSFDADDNPGWVLVDGQPTTTIDGPIAPGDHVEVTISLRVTGTDASVRLVNQAEISAATGPDGEAVTDVDSTPDTVTTNDQLVDDEIDLTPGEGDEDDHDVAEVGLFDLALRKTTDATTVTVGDVVPFDITVFNQGSVAATDITVDDLLPAGTEFVQLANPGWAFADGTASTTIGGPLEPGDQVKVTIFLLVTGSQDEMVNTAEIGEAHGPDGTPVTDIDSTPDDDLTNDQIVDDVIDNTGGDEDDHDIAVIHPQPVVTPSTTTTSTTPTTETPTTETPTTATPTTATPTTETPTTATPTTETPTTETPTTATPTTETPTTTATPTTATPTTATPTTATPTTATPTTATPTTATSTTATPTSESPTSESPTTAPIVVSDRDDDASTGTSNQTVDRTGTRSLPRTGTDPRGLVALGLALLAAGAATLTLRRRRTIH